MAVGRPLLFKTAEEMQVKIDKYFDDIDAYNAQLEPGAALKKPYTITGLALALDTSRETLCNYENKDEFFDTVKRAKLRVEAFAEEALYGRLPTGAIFALKNFGWSDKSEREITGKDGAPVFEGITVNYVD